MSGDQPALPPPHRLGCELRLSWAPRSQPLEHVLAQARSSALAAEEGFALGALQGRAIPLRACVAPTSPPSCAPAASAPSAPSPD